MTIFTDVPVRQSSLDEFTAPLSDVIGAAAGEAWAFNPVPSLRRSSALIDAEQGKQEGLSRAEPETSLLRPDDARQRVRDAGLDGRITVPEEGIRGGTLDLLISRHRDEQRRQDILSRSPSGFVAGFAKFAAGLGASAIDPLNVASAFVPIIGEARYARMLANAGGAGGRAFVRAGVGAAEGAVGAALVEPIVALTANQEQVDYGLSDTLLNIGVGSVMGGGLHVGSGAAADAFGRGLNWWQGKAKPDEATPRMLESFDVKTRETALRTGVAQALTGQAIDVEPVLPRGEENFSTPAAAVNVAENFSVTSEPLPRSFVTEDGFTYQVRKDGTTIRSDQPANVPVDRTVYMAADAVPQVPQGEVRFTDHGNGKVSIATRDAAGRWRTSKAANFPVSDRPAVGAVPVELSQPATVKGASTYSQVRIGKPITAIRPVRVRKAPIAVQAIRETAERQATPGNARMAEPEAVRAADERLKTPERASPDLLLAEAVEDVQRLSEALDVPELVSREMAPYEALRDTAEAYGRAVAAAATCQLRRGA
ncbi:hypothetical protein [Mesorhizobium sp.]|uniref:hypothetical protein n=1 Tax=Mesorhizobium sp. TaxID=1871066 RepID=UPI000FE72359|nr:hypothetical protein [Mesorhizobium sp.]RWN59626.1 MAG: hypothetical protein EOS00_19345 [Mesorhizobium sp.]